MLYYVRRFPASGTQEQQGAALARLVQHAGSLTIYALRVGVHAGLYLEVPDAVAALVELRVLPALVEMEGCLERRSAWAQRPEWTLHALLTPTADAKPLDITLLDGSTSACLRLAWSRKGVAAHLFASTDDTALLELMVKQGWRARVVPTGLAGRMSAALHRPCRTSLRPLLSERPPLTLSAKTEDVAPLAVSPQPAADAPAAVPSFLAVPDAPGLLLGTDQRGAAVALAFRPQRLVIDAPQQDLAPLGLELLRRALALDAGVVAILPRTLAKALSIAPLRERLRVLDAHNPYQSAAIPWRMLDAPSLHAVLRHAGKGSSGLLPAADAQPASTFAALLQRYGAAHLATEGVRSLTAAPGDNLRGAVAAGGGVVLVDDGAADGRLLATLLLHLLAAPPKLERPIVLLRPPGVAVPAALAGQALEVVLGAGEPAHSMLTHTPTGWMLTSADGTWRQTLIDLAQAISPPDAACQRALIEGLTGVASMPEPLPLLVQDDQRAVDDGRAQAELFDWHALADDLHGRLNADPQQEASDAATIERTDHQLATPELLSELHAYVGQTQSLACFATTTPAASLNEQDRSLAPSRSVDTLVDPNRAAGVSAAHLPKQAGVALASPTSSLRLGGRRRAVWRPRSSAVQQPMIEQQTDDAVDLSQVDIPAVSSVFVDETLCKRDVVAALLPASPQPEASRSQAMVEDVATAHAPSSLQAIDLAPVAALIMQGWQQGMRLPTLVAQVAPRYPQATPHHLRGAIRQLIADQLAGVSMAPTEASIMSIDSAPAVEWTPVPSIGTLPSANEPYTAEHEPIPSTDEDPTTLLTPAQAARALGVHVKTIQRWDQDGKIAVMRNAANHRRIPIAEVERLRSMLD